MATLLGYYWCGTCRRELEPKDGVMVGEVRTMMHITYDCLGKKKRLTEDTQKILYLNIILVSHSKIKSSFFHHSH
ncbi:hypothetical protein M3E13_07780 [Oceanobacillus kimchii]|uniref:hypothetical protein n=1 Tax=Oceanobacillus kimchii TaxID=746691 RepID=UPI0021A786FC|nr:hypothetical protein [Oceanobacillus kimchii]MCT1576173.1 hypothetical protein [Oceanobacillus kimchii]MCT2135810.1 hypothetical protein [Oceanobacillus kimchii]